MEWIDVHQPLGIDQAQALVGFQVKWTTRGREVAPYRFANTREGFAIYALPSGSQPILCPEIKAAKPSQSYPMGSGRTGISSSDRLLVRVERFHALTGEALEPYYYAPRLSSIIAYQPMP